MNDQKYIFSFTQLIDKYKINIPLIQRDYVQGVDDQDINQKRKEFLDYLCSDNIPNKTLDFIYGYTDENGFFVPIDGQQRLTTLFLMAIYDTLYNRNSYNLTNFTYELRDATREFVEKLVDFANNAQNIKSDKEPSSIIKNQHWFLDLWEKDISISSMLTTLDDIHSRTGKCNFKEILTNIKLLYLDLSSDQNLFNNAEDIFVKMNSRGMLLTPFQKFKAWLENKLKDRKIAKVQNWTKLIDTEWIDYFWKIDRENSKNEQENDLVEEAENLLHRLFDELILLFALKSGKLDKSKDLSKLKFDFSDYEKLEANDYIEIIELIDKFLTPDGQVEKIDNEIENIKILFQDPKVDQGNLIEQSENLKLSSLLASLKKFSYKERVYLWAVVLWFYYNGTDGLNDFMRILRNLTENTKIDGTNIKKLATELYSFVKNREDLNNLTNITIFDQEQRKEEALKLKLINFAPQWKGLLLEAENNWMFAGQIAFLLRLAMQKDDYDRYKDWEHFIDEFKIIDLKLFHKDNFSCYYKALDSLLRFELIKEREEGTIEEKFLLRRALLTKDDYLPFIRGTKYTFGQFSWELDKMNENWRKIFKGIGHRNNSNKEITALRDLLQESVNDNNICQNIDRNIDHSLIYNWLKNKIDKYETKDWRYFFIKKPKLIDLCSYRQTVGTEHIYRGNTYGTGRKTNDIFTRYLENLVRKHEKMSVPFNHTFYYDHLGDYCFVFENWRGRSIDIRYKNTLIELRLFYRREGEWTYNIADVSKFIKQKLQEVEFVEMGWGYIYNFKLAKVGKNKYQVFIEDFIPFLEKLLCVLTEYESKESGKNWLAIEKENLRYFNFHYENKREYLPEDHLFYFPFEGLKIALDVYQSTDKQKYTLILSIVENEYINEQNQKLSLLIEKIRTEKNITFEKITDENLGGLPIEQPKRESGYKLDVDKNKINSALRDIISVIKATKAI